jgi:hypothetical protein
MKKINFILAILFTGLLFTSCDNKSEDLNYVAKNNLAGRWNIDKVGIVNSQGGIDYSDYVNDSACDVDNIVFNEDLSFQQNDFSTVDGNCQNNDITGTYSQVNHRVVLSNTDIDGVVHTQLFTITKLDNANLEVNYADSMTGGLVFLKLVKE